MVEVMTGDPFDRFLQRRIFEPLGMVDTGYSWSGSDRDRFTTVYTPNPSGGLGRAAGEREVTDANAFRGGSGGLVSTASDYARYCAMMLGGGSLGDVRVLGRKTVELMTMNHIGKLKARGDNTPVDWSHDAYGYGLGVRVMTELANSNAGGSLGEYGWAGAASTYFWIDPREDLFGIFLTQLVEPDFRFAREMMVLTYQALVD
jgi:CubicO group peptidase (beta-lactamase class C family)